MRTVRFDASNHAIANKKPANTWGTKHALKVTSKFELLKEQASFSDTFTADLLAEVLDTFFEKAPFGDQIGNNSQVFRMQRTLGGPYASFSGILVINFDTPGLGQGGKPGQLAVHGTKLAAKYD